MPEKGDSAPKPKTRAPKPTAPPPSAAEGPSAAAEAKAAARTKKEVEALGKTAPEAALRVGRRLVGRELNRTKNSPPVAEGDNSPQANKDRALAKIRGLSKIQQEIKTPDDKGNARNYDVSSDSNPLVVQAKFPEGADGALITRDVTITRITGSVNRNGVEMAQCDCKYTDGAGETGDVPVEITWKQLKDGLIASEGEALTNGFQGAERKMVAFYTSQLGGKEAAQKASAELVDPANLAQTIEEIEATATRTGMVTRKDVETYINSRLATLTPEQQNQRAELEELRLRLGDSIIATPDVLKTLIPNIDGAKVTKDLKSATTNAERLLKQRDDLDKQLEGNNPPDVLIKLKETRSQVNTEYEEELRKKNILEAQQELITLSGGDNTDSIINQYCEQIDNGTIPENQGREFADGIRTGDPGKMLDNLSEPVKDPDESQEAFEERARRHQKIMEIRKKTGSIGILALLGMLVLAAGVAQGAKGMQQ